MSVIFFLRNRGELGLDIHILQLLTVAVMRKMVWNIKAFG